MKRFLFVVIKIAILIGPILIGLWLANWVLESRWGLGNPVIYEGSRLYGYRPKPNQTVTRFNGAVLHFNNLGLRANQDWDERTDNKILFIGDSVTYGGSYIGNADLFSHIAVSHFPGWVDGNAAANAYGVGNVVGRIQKSGFLPSKYIVTVLLEIDFLRGTSTLYGWRQPPKNALHEVTIHFLETFFLRSKYDASSNPEGSDDSEGKAESDFEKERVVTLRESVDQLVRYEAFLNANNVQHLLIISPRKKQLQGLQSIDTDLKQMLDASPLQPVYLKDVLDPHLSYDEIESLYVDAIHLSRDGHQVWGDVIADVMKREWPELVRSELELSEL